MKSRSFVSQRAQHPLASTFGAMNSHVLSRKGSISPTKQKSQYHSPAVLRQCFEESSEDGISDLDAALALLSNAPYPRYDFQNKDGNTPVMVLLHHKKDVEAAQLYFATTVVLHDLSNNKGERLVHLVARRGVIRILHDLQEKGADMKTVTKEGYSALHIAVQENYAAIAEWLLNTVGISSTLQDNHGKTASDYAFSYSMKQLFSPLPMTPEGADIENDMQPHEPGPARRRSRSKSFASWEEMVAIAKENGKEEGNFL